MQDFAADYHDASERAKRPPQAPPCGPRQYQSHDDLCAQWKAADAATDAARWAAISTWVGGISGLLVLLALGLAYQANAISRDTAKRQLRAYLTMGKASIFNLTVGQTPYAQIDFENRGQTPAYEVLTATHFGWHIGEPEPEWFTPKFGNGEGGTVGPNVPILAYPTGPEVWTQAHQDAFDTGALAIYAFGRATYKDAFGEPHFTQFRFIHDRTAVAQKWHSYKSGNIED